MLRPIEVTSVLDAQTICDLATKTWTNEEPGFQVDDVTTLEDLHFVFDTVRLATPRIEAQPVEFADVWPHPDYGIEIVRGQKMPPTTHTDERGAGMSVHHNVTDTFPVKLGVDTSRSSQRGFIKNSGRWPRISTRRIRVGETKPGRLTVFSRGGYPWLYPTMHQFIRPSLLGNEFARYSQSLFGDPENVDQIALQALANIRMITETASPKSSS